MRSYPNHLEERLQTLEGNIHLCMHDPCRQDTKGGTCTRRPSLHCRAASVVPDGSQLDLATVWGVRRSTRLSVGALVSAVADAVHDLTGSIAELVSSPIPASLGDSLASDATGTTAGFSVINDPTPPPSQTSLPRRLPQPHHQYPALRRFPLPQHLNPRIADPPARTATTFSPLRL